MAAVINFACTAQEVEAQSTVDADFVHPVRVALRQRHGEPLAVLAWIGAAGTLLSALLDLSDTLDASDTR